MTAIYRGTTKVAEYVYDAWGNCTITLNTNGYGSRNPFSYRGYYFDSDLNMYYLTTRYYDPKTGRFINADSIEYLDPKAINGLNLYAYCRNNPVMYFDPSGHELLSTTVDLIILGLIMLILFGATYVYLKLTEDTSENLDKEQSFDKESQDPPKIPTNSPYEKTSHFPIMYSGAPSDVLIYATSHVYHYVASFNYRFDGRLNNPNTYTSKYDGKYDAFNSGIWIGYGSGLGNWGDIMEEFFDEYGIPEID
ncbi:MAG: RHS repeat-associated core domain-containing protein [Eubacteriales bacterium]